MCRCRPVYKQICLLSTILALVGSPSWGQKTDRLPNLTNKTFQIVEVNEAEKNEKDVELLLLFRTNDQAVFRVKSGPHIKDNPLRWHMKGDSLRLQMLPMTIDVDGTVESFEREPVFYGLIKTADGYLFTRKNEQMRLVEQK